MSRAAPSVGTTDTDRLPHRRFRPAGARSPVPPTRLPAGVLGMVLLVAGVEATVSRAGPRFLDPVAYSWRFSADAALAEAPGCGVLCLGDSLAKHGLIPRVIEGRTGLRAYNLAVAAGPVPVTYALLRRALDAGARPSAVVFDLKPGMLAGGPRYAVRYWPQALGFAELLGLARAARGGPFVGELFAGAALPTFRSRHEIRGAVLATLQGADGPLGPLNDLCRRNWTVNGGANLATPRPGYAGNVSEAEHDQHLSHRFSAHRVNADYARRLVALAAGHGARAYLVIPPLVAEIQGRRGQSGADAKYAAFVRSLQDRHPGLTVLDARESGYPASVFIDPIHLDARGAATLSTDVAEVLAADRESPPPPRRWVKLPPFRARPVPEGLEDVELSRQRLRPVAGRRS